MLFGHHFLTPILALNNCALFSIGKYAPREKPLAFEENALPYAKGRTFVNPYSAFKFYEQYGFPLVIKPNVGGFSRGAYFPIENKAQLLRASIGVKKWWPNSISSAFGVRQCIFFKGQSSLCF
jgi:pyruvate carboxylase